MVPTTKLTKRQKKGIAFRERKYKKSGVEGHIIADENELDVPSLEDQAPPPPTQGQQSREVGAEALIGRGTAGTESEEAESRVVVGKKRKRKAGEEAKGSCKSESKPTPKRRRGSDGSTLNGMEELIEDHVGAGKTGEESERTKQRFILFLGNLKYTTTPEAIQSHFSICVPPPTVRLLTPKSSTKSPTKPVTKSKGCAFLEFNHRGALQQGLKLHHSLLDGRQVNVELTAGGGGKGSARMKKLKERNKELEGQRRKRQDPKVDAHRSVSQRFSETSGVEQTHVRQRTWTVGDAEEEGTRRGGQKHQKKKRRSSARDFRTGMNAIPVG